MSELRREKIGKYIEVLTDYHANGSYESLKNNVTLLNQKDYAIMIRTLNFERDDFSDDLIYVDKYAYEYLEKSKVYPDDILTNKIANPGSIYIMPNLNCPVSCGMNLFLIRFKACVNQRYMYYCMKNSETYIKSFAHGTTTKTITKEEVRDIDLFIHCDLSEQNKIESTLSNLDRKIQLNKKINDNLQKQIKLIYDYWFTQFDFLDENGRPYKSSGGKMIWNEQLKMEIPEEWAVEKLSIVADILSGYAFESNSYAPEGKYKLITIKNVQDNGIDLNVDNFIENVPQNMPEYCYLKQNDILLSLTGNVGRTGLMYSNDCLLNQRVAVIKPKEIHNSPYLYFLLKSKIMRQKMEILATGTSQKNLSPIETANILIPYNKKLLAEFSNITKEAIEAIVLNLKELNELTSLRDWLLPLLMNGQATEE